MKKKILVLLLAFSMMLSMTACGGGASGDQVLDFSVLSLPSLDPQQFNSATVYPIDKAIFEGLVRTHEDEVNPGVAESWDIAKNNKKMTFHLRKNACWSDGTPLTANDFVYSFRRLADPEKGFAYSWVLYEIENYADIADGKKEVEMLGVSAPDDHTFVIKFCTPAPYYLGFLDLPCFYPVKQEQVEKYGDQFALSVEALTGNGPYICTSYDVDQNVVLEPNQNYWDRDSIKLTRANCTVMDVEASFALLETGDLDFSNIPTAVAPDYINGDKSIDGYETTEYMSGTVDWYSINIGSKTNPILGNKDFRLALNYALDREEYVKIATNGLYAPATRFVLPSVAGIKGKTYDEVEPSDVYKSTAELDKAKKHLEAAMKAEGIKDPSDITISLKISDDSIAALIVENCQAQWSKNLGINVNIDKVTYKAMLNDRVSGDFDLIYAGWIPDYNDPYTYLAYFTSSNPQNGGKFANKRYDELVNTANNYADAKTRLDMYGEAEQILLEEAGLIPLQIRQVPYAYNSKLKNLTRYYLGSEWDWFNCSFE